jgi:S1-C subfamily serine protease
VTTARAGWAVAALIGAACSPAPRTTAADPVAVEVAARPCTTPNRRVGAGVFVTDELVLTAAHVVDGDVRTVTVDGRAGRVVAVDVRLDAALVATSPGQVPARLGDASATDAELAILSPGGGATPVRVLRAGELVVHDRTARADHRRANVVLAGAVAGGTSGAPVVDASGRVVAMVTLSDIGREESHATDARELRVFVEVVAAHDGVARAALDQAGGCP